MKWTNARFLPRLLGQYFTGQKLENRFATNFDAIPNLNYVVSHQDLRSQDFSIRWTGWIVAPKKGRYKLIVRGGDGHRMWLDGKLVMDFWKLGLDNKSTITVLLGDRPHPICITYFRAGPSLGKQEFLFEWQPPDSSKPTPVPAGVFFHSSPAKAKRSG